MNRILPWIVAGLLAAAMIYVISQGYLHGSNGKFLGFIPEADGFGLDDVAKGAVIVGAALLGGKLIHKAVGLPALAAKAA